MGPGWALPRYGLLSARGFPRGVFGRLALLGARWVCQHPRNMAFLSSASASVLVSAFGRWRRAIARLAAGICRLLLSILFTVSAACSRPRVPLPVLPSPSPALRDTRQSDAPVAPVASVPRTMTLPSAGGDAPALVLAAGGDVNLGRGCGQRLLSDPDYDPFRGIARVWADADLRFVNLEAGLSEQHGETQSPHHRLVFTGPPSGAEALFRARVGLVSTANNHAWDYARRGLFETLENLDRVGIAHAGTGRDEDAAYRPAIVHVNGLTVSFFAVTQVWNLGVFSEEDARHYVAWADLSRASRPSRLADALTRARAESDFVVLSYHGGEEYLDAPVPKTRDFVAEVMSLGVDVVIGHHPHVPQGVGWYGARPVFYSLGNLVFDARQDLPWTRSSFIARVRLQRGVPIQVSACPYTIDGFEPMALPAAENEPGRAFERHLRATSASVGGTSVGERDGLGCIRLAPLEQPGASEPTRLVRPLRDLPRVDRGSARLDLR